MGRVLRLGVLASLMGAIAAAVAYLRGNVVERRTPEAQAQLERAVEAVDRELAADLELMTMFDQTRQAFTLENSQWLAVGGALEVHAPSAHSFARSLYERVPQVEAAMERRGPAGSIRDADRQVILEWEGDAREAQRLLRLAVRAPVPKRAGLLFQRLRERLASRR